jgi:hypothetical protein
MKSLVQRLLEGSQNSHLAKITDIEFHTVRREASVLLFAIIAPQMWF